MKKDYVNMKTFVREVLAECIQNDGVSVIIAPDTSLMLVDMLERCKVRNKETFLNIESGYRLDVDLEQARRKGNPMIVTLCGNGEIITEDFHTEYGEEGYCGIKYLIEEEYMRKCGSVTKNSDFDVFSLDFDVYAMQ